jgi:hypothetical protein
MSGNYIQPIKREFLNLSGGTVTGDTVFTQGLYANSLSGGTLYSGSTNLENIFLTPGQLSSTTLSEGSNVSLQQAGSDYQISVVDSPSFDNIDFSGTSTGGNINALNITGDTIYANTVIEPVLDNSVDVGTSFKRFRSLNTVNGVAVSFTASTRVTTPEIVLGTTTVTENNIILSGYTLEGGIW